MAAQIQLTRKYGIFAYDYRIVNNAYTRERCCPNIVEERDTHEEISELWDERYDDARGELGGYSKAYLDDDGITREWDENETPLSDFP